MVKEKIFQDTVHGYISVPEIYCDKIIDTIYFQRLRRIEQTSMRPLYPSARHDRFIHSLGTFHLGRKVFRNVFRNSEDVIKRIFEEDEIECLKNSFELACLLHDCGHSPFSHTFEEFYDKPVCLDDKLCEAAPNDASFIDDLKQAASAKQHEKISALLCLTIFRYELEENLNADVILIARMILGYFYLNDDGNEPEQTKNQIKNCFISLLNGNVIDVDRLDYVSRDKWSSGYSSTNVDIERLISSICIKENHERKFSVVFLKNALSELQSVLDIKDFQKIWVFQHHKVVLDNYLLIKSVEWIIRGKLTPKSGKKIRHFS